MQRQVLARSLDEFILAKKIKTNCDSIVPSVLVVKGAVTLSSLDGLVGLLSADGGFKMFLLS